MVPAISASSTIFRRDVYPAPARGIPLKRATLHLLIQHPQWLGARIMWADGMREAEINR